ncbi:MBL fold metallo-hydrolase [Natronolimnobius sp. AArcel1]|uniref:ComEC/Rec2 family competence protein n=1 Tax=Natronolimnobius sp. AArcel1 TaxID=1679093 RepID=UPI0013EC2BE8|nr:ComEC/Rec2 family competence protein [Natronolimnobius sp. AArcel1]NGM70520.1 MBL fold metallo-hydrolase [Natronolimnobius sp. AArcel1]
MKRLFVVIVVASLLLLAGCAETGADDDTAVEIDDEIEGTDSSESEEEETDAETETETTDESESDSDDGSDGSVGDDETDSGESEPDVDGELEIHHIDVGQADATLLVEPTGETMLIDSGDWPQSGADVIEYLEAQDVDRIDHLVATHAHADHIGGHDAVIEHYETEHDGIGAAYDSGVSHTSQTYDRYLDAIEEYDIELLLVEDGDQLEFGAATANVRNPPAGDSGSDLHYNSVSLTVEFGEFTYLTTGDAEEDAEQRMVDDHGDELEADAYQAGHHGSTTSSTTPFMDHVSPDIAIISSAYDSQYGHPHDEVLEDFADRDIETYWTPVHGDIVLTTDGDDVSLETELEFSTDPAALLDEKPADDDETQSSLVEPGHVTTAPIAG